MYLSVFAIILTVLKRLCYQSASPVSPSRPLIRPPGITPESGGRSPSRSHGRTNGGPRSPVPRPQRSACGRPALALRFGRSVLPGTEAAAQPRPPTVARV